MKKFQLPWIALFLLLVLTACSGETAPIPTAQESPAPETQHYEAAAETSVAVEFTPTAEKAASPAQQAAALAGQPVEAFFEQAFNLILTQDPEWVVELGLPYLMPKEPVLTGFGPEHLEETNLLYLALLDVLHQYDYAALPSSEQISYQVFEWFLDTEIQRYEDSVFKYLVSPVSVRSYPQLFIMFFTESHPLSTPEEAEDYVARIHLLDEKVDQLIARLELQDQVGIIPPRLVIEFGRADIKNYLGSNPQTSSLRTAFHSKASQISGLDAEAFSNLEEDLLLALKEEVFPAYDRLDAALIEMQASAPETTSLSAYPGGAEYYQHLLHQFTTTTLTGEEIHTLGMAEMEQIESEMRLRFAALGYPVEEDISALYKRLEKDSSTLQGEEIAAEYERILQAAEQQAGDYFDLRPQPGMLEVIGGGAGDFYSPGSWDGSRPGRFYARTTGAEAVYKLKTIAYHEGIPGHHFQIMGPKQGDLPFFRHLVGFTGYAEGWALYAEYLAWEMGWYQNDPYGDLGRLQFEALRACRMVVDTGIHAKGWSFEQAVDYMVDNTGLSPGFVQAQVMRYISLPGQATAYMVGKLEIMRIREKAAAALGEDFDLRQFHNVVLQNGSMPLSTLEEVIDSWIELVSNGG